MGLGLYRCYRGEVLCRVGALAAREQLEHLVHQAGRRIRLGVGVGVGVGVRVKVRVKGEGEG